MTATSLYPTPASCICKSPLDSPLESSKICSKLNNSSYSTALATPNSSCLCINNLEEWQIYIPITQDGEREIILDSFLSVARLIQSVTQSNRYPIFISLHLYCRCLASGFYHILPNWLPYILSLSSTMHALASDHSDNNSRHLLSSYLMMCISLALTDSHLNPTTTISSR